MSYARDTKKNNRDYNFMHIGKGEGKGGGCCRNSCTVMLIILLVNVLSNINYIIWIPRYEVSLVDTPLTKIYTTNQPPGTADVLYPQKRCQVK